MARDIAAIKQDLADAKDAYLLLTEGEEPVADQRAASGAVKELQRELSEAITDGADPCPLCGQRPHGIEHQVARGRRVGVEYEIGCLGCVVDPSDPERVSVRGGLLPRHAVEAWNEMVAARVQR